MVLLAWAFWLCAEYLVFGRWSYALLYDFGDSFIPYYLGDGTQGFWALFGGWEPRMLAGVDAGANTISQFRLTNLFTAAMPVWLAVGLIAFIQRAVAAVFMYRLVVDAFGGKPAAAFAAAAVFAVGIGPVGAEADFGFTHNMGFAPCFLPLLLWCQWRYGSRNPWAVAGIMFALGALIAVATMFFVAVFSLLAFALILAASTPLSEWRRLLPGVVALGAGYLICEFPNVVAVGADWPAVHRLQNPPIPAADRWRTLQNALHALAAANAVPLVAMLAALSVKARTVSLRPVIAVFAICLVILSLDGIIATAIPENATLMNFSFSRIAFAMPFVVLLGAALALSRLLSAAANAGTGARRFAGLMIAGFLVTAVVSDARVKFNNLRYYSHGSTYAVMYDQAPMHRVAALRSDTDPFRVTTLYVKDVTHINRASFSWAYGLETVDGYVNAYPRRYQELWVETIRKVDGKIPFDYEKMRDWGNRLYLIAPGSDCSSVRLEESANLNLLSLLNVRFVVSPCPLKDESLRLFAENRDGPGQSWHRRPDREKLLSIFRREFPARELFVYENPRKLPRYFVTGGARVFDTPGAALAALGAADLETLRSQAFVARTDAAGLDLPAPRSGDAGSVRILSVARDEIRLAVEARHSAVLIAANSFNPRWTATVNGAPSPLFRADHTLQAVVVGAGRSEVVLRYRTALSELFGR